MQLNSRQSMFLVAILLGGFFIVSFAFLNSHQQSLPIPTHQSSPPLTATTSGEAVPGIVATAQSVAAALHATIAPPSSGNPAVEITNFQRSENKDGKLAWELAGSSARYELGGSRVEIKDAHVKTRLSNGTVATLTTPLATILMNGTTLNEAQGARGVTISLDSGVQLTTDSARYERTVGKVSSPSTITITHPSGSLTSDQFSGDTIKQIFVFTGSVHTTILPSKKHER